MEQLQSAPVSLPHIVQVYQPAVSIHPSLPNQDTTITTDSLEVQSIQKVLTQNQTVMSCQQIHLQNVHQTIQAPIQAQVLQRECQPMHITSHLILPQAPIFKQHLLTGVVPQHYYRQYNTYLKEDQCVITKIEPEVTIELEKQPNMSNTENKQIKRKEKVKKTERIRRLLPEPSQWKSNIRKQQCQRGEAYVSRRGKIVPEKRIRNTKDCLTSCRYRCMEKINDDDRQLIFKAFYSLDANEKKHFLLNTTERHLFKNKDKPCDGKRNYSFKYFFLVRATRHMVCKNFYLGTLAISQKPVYNVHLNKSDVNLPKRDGRGLSESSCHALPNEAKDRVRKHIMSFKTIDSKAVKPFSTRIQYLDPTLNVKQMHVMYIEECEKVGGSPLKESMYRKIFKREFNLRFKREKTCSKCKGPVKNN